VEPQLSTKPIQSDMTADFMDGDAPDVIDQLERATRGIRLRRPQPRLVQAWEALLRDDVAAPSGLLRHLRPAA
jgi:hypothetical protein